MFHAISKCLAANGSLLHRMILQACCSRGAWLNRLLRLARWPCTGMVATEMTQGNGGMAERKIQPTVSSISSPLHGLLFADREWAVLASIGKQRRLYKILARCFPAHIIFLISQDIAEAAMLAVRTSKSACPQVRRTVSAHIFVSTFLHECLSNMRLAGIGHDMAWLSAGDHHTAGAACDGLISLALLD